MTLKLELKDEPEKLQEKIGLQIKQIGKIDVDHEVKRRKLTEVYQILADNNLKIVCEKITKDRYMKRFTYEDLTNVHESLGRLFKNLDELKEAIDRDNFILSGEMLDIKELKKRFRAHGKHEQFPNFDIQRLKELFQKPPRRLKPMDGHTNEEIVVNNYVFRKYLYAIIQMVVNEMDLVVLFTGQEGTGKSCACSQDMSIVYYILKELKLITYAYDIKNMWFASLPDFIDAEDRFFKEKFRILGLDEGNELHRQEWQNDTVKTFFQRLRRERYNQRIKFICIPQLKEILKSIVISRTNIVWEMGLSADNKSGTLDKGLSKMAIIPRGEFIYSRYHRKELKRQYIIDTLGNILDDSKKHIATLPEEIIVLKYYRNAVWGFDKKKYERYLKDKNRTFSVSKGARLTEYQAYCYYVARPKLKDWHIDRTKNKEIYATLSKMDRVICSQFENDPDKLKKYERFLKGKEMRRIEAKADT